jgi:hypothetical protein
VGDPALWKSAAERFRELSRHSKAGLGPIPWTRARLWVGRPVGEATSVGAFEISTQILQEFFHVSTRKIRNQPRAERLNASIIRPFKKPSISVRSARLSFRDGSVVAAARRRDAEQLYIEDPSQGRIIEGVEAVNPFR